MLRTALIGSGPNSDVNCATARLLTSSEIELTASQRRAAFGREGERRRTAVIGRLPKALRADPALSEPLCKAALRAVLRRALPPEAAPDNPDDLP